MGEATTITLASDGEACDSRPLLADSSTRSLLSQTAFCFDGASEGPEYRRDLHEDRCCLPLAVDGSARLRGGAVLTKGGRWRLSEADSVIVGGTPWWGVNSDSAVGWTFGLVEGVPLVPMVGEERSQALCEVRCQP